MTVLFLFLFILMSVFVVCLLYVNKNLARDNDVLKNDLSVCRSKGQEFYLENQRLITKYKPVINAEDKAREIILGAEKERAAGKAEALRIIETAKAEANKTKKDTNNEITHKRKELEQLVESINNEMTYKRRELEQLIELRENAHKEYKFRKTLPESYEKLKVKYEELKDKCDQLVDELKDANIAIKSTTIGAKEKEKIVSQFDKLGKNYIEDTFRFVVSKLTVNNFTASRDRILKTISICRAMGFNWNENIEDEYTEKVREEFKKVLRIEEAKLEQQRIKEQIREEQRQLREIDALKKKEEQAIKERQDAERSREVMQRAIEEALAKANGEHTAQILEMENALAEKDLEIAAKQQEIDENQRAISNAQITKAGYVYVLSNIGSFGEGVFKIGMTRRDNPQERVDELGDASVPFPFDVHIMVSSDNAPELEKSLHHRFNNMRVNRINLRKEYFRIDVDDVQREIELFLGKQVEYRANPHVLEEYAEQYRQSQQTTLADIEEIESLYAEAGIDEDV